MILLPLLVLLFVHGNIGGVLPRNFKSINDIPEATEVKAEEDESSISIVNLSENVEYQENVLQEKPAIEQNISTFHNAILDDTQNVTKNASTIDLSEEKFHLEVHSFKDSESNVLKEEIFNNEKNFEGSSEITPLQPLEISVESILQELGSNESSELSAQQSTIPPHSQTTDKNFSLPKSEGKSASNLSSTVHQENDQSNRNGEDLTVSKLNESSESRNVSGDSVLSVISSETVDSVEDILSNDIDANNTKSFFSGSSFEFLLKSEVAKNAAQAFQVFNFSDSITDHIIEENEVHGFLTGADPQPNSSDPPQNETGAMQNSANSNTNPLPLAEAHDVLNQTETVESESSNVNEGFQSGNGSFKQANSSTNNNKSEESISDLIDAESIIEFTPNVTSNSSGNSTDLSKCPPPGLCLFWFWSQDACAEDKHCLDTKICCRVGCSKACIQV